MYEEKALKENLVSEVGGKPLRNILGKNQVLRDIYKMLCLQATLAVVENTITTPIECPDNKRPVKVLRQGYQRAYHKSD